MIPETVTYSATAELKNISIFTRTDWTTDLACSIPDMGVLDLEIEL